MSNFRKKLMLATTIPLGIILVLTAALFFIGSDISRQTGRIKQLKMDLSFRLQSTESLALLRKESQEAKIYTYEIENVLPERDELVSFPRDLSTIARHNKIELNIILGQESSAGKLRKTIFTMTGQVPFDNFINFLKSLENAQYFVNLSSIDITRQEDGFKTLATGQVFSL